jgi:glucose/arabinose dehydrogenase
MSARRILLAGSMLSGLLLSGCATFTAQPPPESWKPQQSLTPQAGPEPHVPGEGAAPPGGGPQPPSQGPIPPPNGCTDFNPLVIATCLSPVSAVVALPGNTPDPVALVAERATGRILRVRKDQDPVVVATLPVTATGDGGLTGLALSPNYLEDRLLFAYITTPTDNRVVRIAEGDSPKPVLTGIPKGPSGNRGALTLDRRGGQLLLATGDAGSPNLAADANSLAGKVLRIGTDGKAAPDNPVRGSAVILSGLHAPGGMCGTPDGSRVWFTDSDASRDLLYRLEPGKPLGEPAWTWPDRPGVTGCAAGTDMLTVTTSLAGNLQTLTFAPDGSFRGKPVVSMTGKDGFGRLSGIDLVSDTTAVVGTVNKDPGGAPVSSDDRAFLTPTGGGAPSKD